MARLIRMTGPVGFVEVLGGKGDDLADLLATAREAYEALGEPAPRVADGLRPLPNPVNWLPSNLGTIGFGLGGGE
jgi:hypothetical protein